MASAATGLTLAGSGALVGKAKKKPAKRPKKK